VKWLDRSFGGERCAVAFVAFARGNLGAVVAAGHGPAKKERAVALLGFAGIGQLVFDSIARREAGKDLGAQC